MERKGGQVERWAEIQRGSVTVTTQLSQLTGLSRCSASVRSMERCTILSSASRL